MVDLRKRMEALGFTKVITILNSGNVIFSASKNEEAKLEKIIAKDLDHFSGFLFRY